MLSAERGRSKRAVGLAILASAALAGCGSQAATTSRSTAAPHTTTVVLTQSDAATAQRALARIQSAGKICREHEGDQKWLTTIIAKRLEAAEGAHALAQLVHSHGKSAVVSTPGQEATLSEYVARADLALESCPSLETIASGLRQAS